MEGLENASESSSRLTRTSCRWWCDATRPTSILFVVVLNTQKIGARVRCFCLLTPMLCPLRTTFNTLTCFLVYPLSRTLRALHAEQVFFVTLTEKNSVATSGALDKQKAGGDVILVNQPPPLASRVLQPVFEISPRALCNIYVLVLL